MYHDMCQCHISGTDVFLCDFVSACVYVCDSVCVDI